MAAARPWKSPVAPSRLRGLLPTSLTLTLADRLYVERSGLPQPLLNRLIRLAAFANPAFYKAQAMRLSVWDKPRVIGCAENFPQHIALPRGCLESVQTLLQEQGTNWELVDERQNGSPLVLVHRAELLRQWQERLQSFLDVPPGAIGCIGGGKAKPTGQLDIAVMQSLVRKGQVNPVVQGYGQVKARHVLGLSATLVRRDGLQPILFMQCGPIVTGRDRAPCGDRSDR